MLQNNFRFYHYFLTLEYYRFCFVTLLVSSGLLDPVF